MLLLLGLIAGMAFRLQSYLIATVSGAMLPALDDYRKKRRAIHLQLKQRNLA